jgi:hypothetical protein
MIHLGLLGFDAAPAKSLSIALKSRAADVCQHVEPEAASVVLVDIDTLNDPSVWRNLAQSSSTVLVAATQKPELPEEYKQDFTAVIAKPLRFTAMLTAISAALDKGQVEAQRLTSTSEASEKIEKVQKTRKTDVLRSQSVIDPNKFLLGLVLHAVEHDSPNQCRYIHLAKGYWLVINKKQGRVYLSMSAKTLSHAAIMDFSGENIVNKWVSANQLTEVKAKALRDIPIEEFVWELTRDTVRNAHLSTFDPDQRYRLKQWPDLTRYSAGSRDIAMASFWIESNASARELSAALGMSVNDVLPFATCCYTCGLLQPVDAQIAMTSRKPEKGIKKLLSMILKKLDR